MKNDFLEWRIKKYSVLLNITRNLNEKADTANYLMKLNFLIKKLIQNYGFENIKSVVAHSICFKHLNVSDSIYEWAKNAEPVSFENDKEEKRNYYELVLKCNPKTIIKNRKATYAL